MHAVNRYIVKESHCTTGRLSCVGSKLPEQKIFSDMKDLINNNSLQAFQSDSIENEKLTSKADIVSFDAETSVLCHNKPTQNNEFNKLNYGSIKSSRNQLRNCMKTALGLAIAKTRSTRISVNKIDMTQISIAEHTTCVISTEKAPSLSALLKSSATLGVPTLLQRSLKFSVFSPQAWYQYLIMFISLAVIKLSFGICEKTPVISKKTKKIFLENNCPQKRLTTSKITPPIEKVVLYSQPSRHCKILAPVLPAVHSPAVFLPHRKFRLLPSLRATSFCTLLSLIMLETVLLSTVSNCAKTFYMHWNTSNSIFRIDNTDHIIDVNKGNLAFEFDQVHIICPVYEPGTFENETEKYIIYNVSKVEYETCRITNADPRVIAICDKPQKLMFFTITFRPFTPQPGGLEFLPGNDYYFISTSSKDDLYRRIGGRCSTNNMKVVFKVCCAVEENNKTTSAGAVSSNVGSVGIGISNSSPDGITSGIEISPNVEVSNTHANLNQHMKNSVTTGLIPIGTTNVGSSSSIGNIDAHTKSINGGSGTSINTNIDQFSRIPIQAGGVNVMGNNVASIGNIGLGGHGGGIMLTSGGHGGLNVISAGGGTFGIGQYPALPGQTGIRVNNVASQHHAKHKNIGNNDDPYDKHPNEVVKNEELTYNSGAIRIQPWTVFKVVGIATSWPLVNLFEWLLRQSRTSLSSISTTDRNTKYEDELFPHLRAQRSFYSTEKGKPQNTANFKFLTFNFNKLVICFIVVFTITIFVISSRTRLNDNMTNKWKRMEKLSISNAIMRQSLLDTFDSYVKKMCVFIDLKSFVHPKIGELAHSVGEGTVDSKPVCNHRNPSKSIQAEINNSKINKLIQPLINYCHIELASVSAKVKRFR